MTTENEKVPAVGSDRDSENLNRDARQVTTGRPAYNGDPPAHLRDPVVRRMAVARAEWTRALRGRVVMQHAAVAHTLAAYGNKDGSNCHPGMDRLVGDLLSSKSTVTRSMNWLVDNGWLSLVKRGAKKLGEANVYQLTVPLPVAADLGLSTSEGPMWVERPESMDRSRYTPRDPGGRATKREGADAVLGSTVDTYSDFLGVNQEFLGVNQEFLGVKPALLGSTGDTPPGPKAPGPSNHHSDAAASGSSLRDDRDDDSFNILERIEQAVGGFEVGEERTADGMLADGRHLAAIINKIRADRTWQPEPELPPGPCPYDCTHGYVLNGNLSAYCPRCRPKQAAAHRARETAA